MVDSFSSKDSRIRLWFMNTPLLWIWFCSIHQNLKVARVVATWNCKCVSFRLCYLIPIVRCVPGGVSQSIPWARDVDGQKGQPIGLFSGRSPVLIWWNCSDDHVKCEATNFVFSLPSCHFTCLSGWQKFEPLASNCASRALMSPLQFPSLSEYCSPYADCF